MKAKTASPETAVLTAERKLHNTWVYIKRHWQLYLLFLLPAVALTLVFKYAPMGGVLIAFQKYNPFKGIWGSEWVGFKNFTRFMSSPDFQRYLINTLKLSVYGLLWGFPIPILLAFLLNRIESKKIKQKVQLVLYMPNFISVIVLCGIVRVLLSVTGPVNGLLHTSINFMTLPEAFRPIYIISGIWQGAGWARIRADLLGISPDVPPLDAVRDVVARHMSAYSSDEMAALDRLMRSSKTLKARKQAFYAEQELALFETLCEVWRQPERRLGLRMVAVASIGALRVTTQLWGEKPVAAQPMAELFRAALDGLASELGANDAK